MKVYMFWKPVTWVIYPFYGKQTLHNYYNKKDKCIKATQLKVLKIEAMRINNSISLSKTKIKNVNKWLPAIVYGKFEEQIVTHAKQHLYKFVNGLKNNLLIKENKHLAK